MINSLDSKFLEHATFLFNQEYPQKFIKGSLEHYESCGPILEAPGIVDRAIEEVLDQWSYLVTMRCRINQAIHILEQMPSSPDREELLKLLK